MRGSNFLFYTFFIFLLVIFFAMKGFAMANDEDIDKIKQEYNVQIEKWKSFLKQIGVGVHSSPYAYIDKEAFDNIIAMGTKVIPFIFEDIINGRDSIINGKDSECLLIYALEKITNEKPYEKKVYLMSEKDKENAWLKWWEENKGKYVKKVQ